MNDKCDVKLGVLCAILSHTTTVSLVTETGLLCFKKKREETIKRSNTE